MHQLSHVLGKLMQSKRACFIQNRKRPNLRTLGASIHKANRLTMPCESLVQFFGSLISMLLKYSVQLKEMGHRDSTILCLLLR